ncbi:MAG: hypothetical protein IJN02_01750 [Bacteroidales bacterium]|nr:hypothetical protein [Bacteroidales bacterium]MBQ6687937.1 hypothetical protein [Bacteroidales bacterium]
MGFSFNFFGTQEVRKFNYRPRFYDPEKEERRKKYGDYAKKKEGEEYVPGKYVKGSLRDGNYQRTQEIGRNQKAIGMLTTLLLFLVVYLIYKYYPFLIQALSQ